MRQHIGIVFQDHKILFDRNVAKRDAVLCALLATTTHPPKSARVAIEKVGLAGRASCPTSMAYQGGEQQRLCIARAVVHQPSLLIADEPSANLTAPTR